MPQAGIYDEREFARAAEGPRRDHAAASALDTSLIVGRTKNSAIVHVTSSALKTIYGYHRSLCGVDLQEMLWDTVHPNDLDCIDCINCRKIALRDKQNEQ